MNPVSEDIKDLLVTAGYVFGGTADWAIYIAEEPPKTPAKVITIYDVPGPRPDYYMNAARKPLLWPEFQIRVRSTTYLEGWIKQRNVAARIDRHARFTVNGAESADPKVQYQSITKRTSDPQYLGKDSNNLFLFTWVYQATRRER